jgi:hypothetical protein
MTQKTFALISGIIFTIVALVHALRLAQGWGIAIDGWDVPMWLSWAGLIIPGVLGFYGLRFGLKQ